MEWNPPGFYLKKNRMTKINKLCTIPRISDREKQKANFTNRSKRVTAKRVFCQKTGLWREVRFKGRMVNFEYFEKLEYKELLPLDQVPFLSSYIHTNSTKKGVPKLLEKLSETTVNKALSEDGRLIVETEPRFFSDFEVWYFLTEKCSIYEPVRIEKFTSSTHKTQFHKLYKLFERAGKKYDDLWRRRKVTPLFMTLTDARRAKGKIGDFIREFSRRCNRFGVEVYDYIWVMEVSDNEEYEDNHIHYHALFYLSRVNVSSNKVHRALFEFEPKDGRTWLQAIAELWGGHVKLRIEQKGSSVGYLTSGAMGYLSKHSKGSKKIRGLRRYGKSKGL